MAVAIPCPLPPSQLRVGHALRDVLDERTPLTIATVTAALREEAARGMVASRHHALLVGPRLGSGVYGVVYQASWGSRSCGGAPLRKEPDLSSDYFALKIMDARRGAVDPAWVAAAEAEAEEAEEAEADDAAGVRAPRHHRDEDGGDAEVALQAILREVVVATMPRRGRPWARIVADGDDWTRWGLLMPLEDGTLDDFGWSGWLTGYRARYAALADADADADALAEAEMDGGMPDHERLAHDAAASAPRERMPLPFVLVVGRQVAEQLAALHAVGIMHRDVKPSNILLTWPDAADASAPAAAATAEVVACTACAALHHVPPRAAAAAAAPTPSHSRGAPPRVTLADPSLATAAPRSLDRAVVTAWWRAPELLRCAAHAVADCPLCGELRRHGEGVDVWALGCMLLAAATGRYVTTARHSAAILADWATTLPALLREVAGRAPALHDCLRRMLAPDPAARPSAAEVAAHACWSVPPSRRAAESWDAARVQAQRVARHIRAARAAVPRRVVAVPVRSAAPAPAERSSLRLLAPAPHRRAAAAVLSAVAHSLAPGSRDAYRLAFAALRAWDAACTDGVALAPTSADWTAPPVTGLAAALYCAMSIVGDRSVSIDTLLRDVRAARGDADVTSVGAAEVCAAVTAIVCAPHGIGALWTGQRDAGDGCAVPVGVFELAARVAADAGLSLRAQRALFAAALDVASAAPRWQALTNGSEVDCGGWGGAAAARAPPQRCACCRVYRATAGALRGIAVAALSPRESAEFAAALPHACAYAQGSECSPSTWALRAAAHTECWREDA